MTAINLDGQIVASAYDPATRICSYTYQHTDGSRYTVQESIDTLHKCGPMPASKQQRRDFITNKIVHHIRMNPPDQTS